MPRKAEISSELFQAALGAARNAGTGDELRMALVIILPCMLRIPDSTTAKVLGRSRSTVLRFRSTFKQLHSGGKPSARNWGGRRYGHLSVEEERRFLSRFLQQAEEGGVIVVSEIKRAFESLIGKKVAKTTIYRLLDRHGWRKIMPRPRHPGSDPKARKGFKKTSKTGDSMR
jgi:transposase